MQLDLHEKGLAGLAAGPVVTVVHVSGPLEVVVSLAEPATARPIAADAGVVTRLLEQHRDGDDFAGEVDLEFAATAAVVMGSDRRLVTPGDEGRPTGRADGGSRKRPTEPRSLRSQLVDMRGVDRFLAIAGEVRRHVVDDDPDDVGTGSWLRSGGSRRENRHEDEEEADVLEHRGAPGV